MKEEKKKKKSSRGEESSQTLTWTTFTLNATSLERAVKFKFDTLCLVLVETSYV